MSGKPLFPRGCANDTSPDARARQIEILRRMPPGEWLRSALELTAFVQRLQEAGQRRLHPNASEGEIMIRAAASRLDKETLRKVYGWAPGDPGEP
jgi:hypothetical protein